MDRKPNVLIIVTDQERFDVLGSNGSAVCRTPNLDRLAARGVRFDQAFTTTALCSPARGSMLTGLYPHAHGVMNNTHDDPAIAHELDRSHLTWVHAARSRGYRLGYVGKWHLGRTMGPADHGFHDDRALVYDVDLAEADRPLIDPHRATFGRDSMVIAGVDPAPADATDSAVTTNDAIDLLTNYAKGDEPFVLRVDYEGPHHPYMPPASFASLYDPDSIEPWANFVDADPNKPPAHHRLFQQRGVAGWTWEQWQPVIALYYGFVSYLDAEIGRILDTMANLGLSDDTIVIHTTDHGDMAGSHGGHFNKGPIMYEEIYHIPLIVADPRTAHAGTTCSNLVSTVDLMPTVVDLIGADVPVTHGASMVDSLNDPAKASGRPAVFAEYHGEEWGLYSQRMVRTADAKYVYSPHGVDELYDLRHDPHELHNLVGDESSRELASELQEHLVHWMSDTDDPLYGWARRVLPE